MHGLIKGLIGQILEAKNVEELWNHNLKQTKIFKNWSKGLTTSPTKEFDSLEFKHK